MNFQRKREKDCRVVGVRSEMSQHEDGALSIGVHFNEDRFRSVDKRRFLRLKCHSVIIYKLSSFSLL